MRDLLEVRERTRNWPASLAFVAGFVNSGGFILIGSLHVPRHREHVGRLSNNLATDDLPAALFAAFMVLAFFVGAFVASLILEGLAPSDVPRAYALALLSEGMLLLAFVFIVGPSRTTSPRILDEEAAILSAAMGIQNSLVTRLSGAVVRTTHLTGVVTDLGIECARWYRWSRSNVARALEPAVTPVNRPAPAKTLLLATIFVSFILGATLGATLTLRASRWAMLLPAVAVLLASTMAFRTPRTTALPSSDGAS